MENNLNPKEQPVIIKTKKKHGIIYETIQFIVIAALIIIPFRMFIAQPFIVSGESMDPTFKDGEYLIVDQLSYRFKSPERDSVIIFKYPNNPSQFFIKRVIGLPGEKVKIDGDKITIINKEHPEPTGMILNESFVEWKTDFGYPFKMETTLKDDEYFVLGDNRARSSDSRFWGPLNKNFIIGQPILRLLPINKAQIYPGDYKTK
jgi:signal peptidase I